MDDDKDDVTPGDENGERTTSSVSDDEVYLTRRASTSAASQRRYRFSINGSSTSEGGKQLKRQKSLERRIDMISDSKRSQASKARARSPPQRTTSLSNLRSRTVRVPRETKASIRRKELAHSNSRSADDGSATYLTPFQRREETIRELRRVLRESQERLREKDRQIQEIVSEKDVQLSALLTGKDNEIHSLQDKVRDLEQECLHLREFQEKLKDERDLLKLKNKEQELDAKEREEYQKDMFLLMYEKGKQCANFERQDTLEELASQDPTAVTVPELLTKLEQMQDKLSELQSTTRTNQYQDGRFLSPKTDSEATLRCMKDALFHYLTSEGYVAKSQNLNILLGLAAFTDVQRKKIDAALSKPKAQKKNS